MESPNEKRSTSSHIKRAETRGPFDVDALTHVLECTRFRFKAPGAHEFTAPWGVRFGGMKPADLRRHAASLGLPVPPFDPPKSIGDLIVVTRGNCWVDVEEEGIKLPLAAGDVVLLTRDTSFVLRDNPRTPTKHISDLVRRERIEKMQGVCYGGGGESATLLIGRFFFENDDDKNPLLAALPPVILIRRSESELTAWLDGTVKFLNHELSARGLGSQSVINHLAHIFFVQAVRAHAASMPEDAAGNWIHAILDPEIALALGLIQRRPAEPWTVALLAELSNSSRSAFSARFTAKVGLPPLQYVAKCRMRTAKVLLRDTKHGVKYIAEKIGYANESAFGNAFRRIVGQSPGAYRKRAKG